MAEADRSPYRGLAGTERVAPQGHVAVAGVGHEILQRVAAVVGESCQGTRGLAGAIGLALAGRRATAFLGGQEMGVGRDLLARAVALRLPIVVHLGLEPETSRGGHAALHMAATTGAVVLVAANLQEAVDLALVGRRVAEAALVPVVVAADARETLDALQETVVPGGALVRAWLGEAGATIHARTPAEEEIFGRHRRRLPSWHDPARPLLAGTALGSEVSAAATAARRIYFDPRAEVELHGALDSFAEVVGRRYETLRQHRLRGARVVLVLSGAAVESAEVVADALADEGLRVGVVGLRCFAPFPATALVPLLAGRGRVVVVERSEGPLGGEAPLIGAVREALARAVAGRGRRGDAEPTLAPRRVPSVRAALWGLGGSSRRAGDLAELCRRALVDQGALPSTITVGVEPLPDRSGLPKRRVLFDGLRRHYPEASASGVRGEILGVRPQSLVVEARGSGAARLIRAAGEVLFDAAGGSVRSRLDGPAAVLTWSARPLDDPGDEPQVQILVGAGGDLDRTRVARLAPGATILLPPGKGGLLPEARRLAEERSLDMRSLASVATPAAAEDRHLGALLALVAERAGIERRALLTARRRLLEARRFPGVDESLAAFEAGLDGLEVVHGATAAVAAAIADAAIPAGTVPADAVDAAPVASLARFWDQVGILETEERGEAFGADPCLVTGSVPAMADALRDVSMERSVLPVFEPSLCTGCGACWSLCPHGAVAPLVSSPTGLVEIGMAQAQEAGQTVDALRPVLSKLGTGLRRELSADGLTGTSVGAPLRAAFAGVVETASFSEERLQAIDAAFGAVCDALDELPVARTEPLFDRAEAQKRGSGTLLSVALSPHFCKGCGVCVAACEPGALDAVADDRAGHGSQVSHWRLAVAAPSPPSEVLSGLRNSPDVGPLAATLLEAPARRIMSGGDGAPSGEGSAIVLRQALGVLAARLAPAQDGRRQALKEVRESLAGAIHDELARALPEDDLGALARGLDAVELPDIDLGALTGRVEGALESHRVDVPRLRELVAVARRLSDLALEEAESRRRAGVTLSLVLGPGATLSWANSFPHGPFAVPAVADTTGETVPLARGLLRAARAAAVEEARLLRRARRLVKGGTTGREEAALRWEDLDATERQACPPLVLAMAESALGTGGAGVGSLLELLSGSLPVVVLLLSEADLGLGESSALDWETLLVSLPHPFVAQCSPAAPNHLERCLSEALQTDGPAVIRLHAPSPGRHGFAADLAPARAEEAVACRVFPLLRRAAARGEVLPPLDLTRNPDPAQPWSGGRTPAHWAFGETRFAEALTPVGEQESATVPMLELLALDVAERAGKTPVVEDETGARFRVSEELVRAVERRARVWSALRSLSSLAEVEAERSAGRTAPELEERHRTETERLRNEYEERIASLRTAVQGELAQRLRSRLLDLAMRRRRQSVHRDVDAAASDEGGAS